jgi:hypothetical protein
MDKAKQALQQLHLIRSSEMYRQQNRQRTHLDISERERLDYAIKALQELLESEKVGV